METYIDGFVFPILEQNLQAYREVAEQVAEVWKAHGATEYREFAGDDLTHPGLRSFADLLELKEDEVAVFGWVVFPSKTIRDQANEQVKVDPKMEALVAPLTHPDRMIFDFRRMVYGGFQALVQSDDKE